VEIFVTLCGLQMRNDENVKAHNMGQIMKLSIVLVSPQLLEAQTKSQPQLLYTGQKISVPISTITMTLKA
jgi:hypothetical protein